MGCSYVRLPDGTRAIVCGYRQRQRRCACGRPSTRLCDWKIAQPERGRRGGKPKTCDAPLCDQCTHSPAPEKDLCKHHAAEWADRLAQSTKGSPT